MLALVLSLVVVGVVVATPTYDSGSYSTSYGCCIRWVAWAEATAGSGYSGWYYVWAKVGNNNVYYGGSYHGPLDVYAEADEYTRPLHYVKPSIFHQAYCNYSDTHPSRIPASVIVAQLSRLIL